MIQYHGIWDTDELDDLEADTHETENLIAEPGQQPRVAKMRRQLYEKRKEAGGLVIPLGCKRNHGSNLRRADGSRRAEFPERMLQQTAEA